MIQHIVLLRFKPGTAEEKIGAAGDALLAMRGRIPEIREVRWATNLGPSADEYSHVLTVVADDMAAVDRYLVHPLHQQTVAEYLGPIREARLALDIEA
jgi:stress responsive alpha/beta barrel protein